MMKISGIQKTTLIDYPGKIACTIFLSGCNFRCSFCHNPELVLLKPDTENISKESILRFLEKRKLYLDGVCITGGEPLITLEEDFLRKIKELGYLIKLDTNGSFPEKLEEFIKKGLIDFVAMDIKASKEKYKEIIRAELDLEKIEKSIKLISKLKNYEFRTTIIERVHNVEELEKISQWLNDLLGGKPKKFALQGFKNRGKILGEDFKNLTDTPEEYLIKIKEAIKKYFENVEIRV